ncbi:MAG: methyltransferase domain-containing protein [Polyangiaceae bacterium]
MTLKPPAYLALIKRAQSFVDFEKTLLEESMRDSVQYAKGDLVDVGCGDKPYEALFAPKVSKYVGIEYNETYGTSFYKQHNPKADITYSGDRLPFGDASFDTVLSNQVGEHVPHPEAFFAELARVLRPGGNLIFTVPFSYRIHSDPNDFHRFTKYALRQYASDAGLDVVRLDPRGGFWSVIGQKLTSHMALHWARMNSDIQELGEFGYEKPETRKPRYWTLPVLGPAIFGAAAVTKVLDRVDYDESDTIGYTLVAKKP